MYNFNFYSDKKCLWCKRLEFIIKKKFSTRKSKIFFSPNKKKSLLNIKKAKAIIKKKVNRSTKRIFKLQNSLTQLKNQMKNISTPTLD